MSNMASVVNSNIVKAHTIPSVPTDRPIPDAWHQMLQGRLSAGENVLASLEVNLDERLNYAKQLILLTNQRLIGLTWQAPDCSEYPLNGEVKLRQRDHAGIGCIEVFAAGARLAVWRYTMARDPDVTRFVRQFERAVEMRNGQSVVDDRHRVCPQCLAVLPPNQEKCAFCEVESGRGGTPV